MWATGKYANTSLGKKPDAMRWLAAVPQGATQCDEPPVTHPHGGGEGRAPQIGPLWSVHPLGQACPSASNPEAQQAEQAGLCCGTSPHLPAEAVADGFVMVHHPVLHSAAFESAMGTFTQKGPFNRRITFCARSRQAEQLRR